MQRYTRARTREARTSSAVKVRRAKHPRTLTRTTFRALDAWRSRALDGLGSNPHNHEMDQTPMTDEEKTAAEVRALHRLEVAVRARRGATTRLDVYLGDGEINMALHAVDNARAGVR